MGFLNILIKSASVAATTTSVVKQIKDKKKSIDYEKLITKERKRSDQLEKQLNKTIKTQEKQIEIAKVHDEVIGDISQSVNFIIDDQYLSS